VLKRSPIGVGGRLQRKVLVGGWCCQTSTIGNAKTKKKKTEHKVFCLCSSGCRVGGGGAPGGGGGAQKKKMVWGPGVKKLVVGGGRVSPKEGGQKRGERGKPTNNPTPPACKIAPKKKCIPGGAKAKRTRRKGEGEKKKTVV